MFKAHKDLLKIYYFINEIKNKKCNTYNIFETIDKKNIDYNKL